MESLMKFILFCILIIVFTVMIVLVAGVVSVTALFAWIGSLITANVVHFLICAACVVFFIVMLIKVIND